MSTSRRERRFAHRSLVALSIPILAVVLSQAHLQAQEAAPTKPAPAAPKDTPKEQPKDPPKSAPEKGTETPATPAPAAPVPEAPKAGPMQNGALFKNLDGTTPDLADAAGKPMVIELWATWCGPCRAQRRHMHAMSAKYPDVIFIAASVDQNAANAVRVFLAENKSPKDSLLRDYLATPELQAALDKVNNQTSIPKIAYVSKKGRLVDVASGSQNEKFFETMIRNLAK